MRARPLLTTALLWAAGLSPALAQDILPPRLTCDLVATCAEGQACTPVEDPRPTFSLILVDQTWLWDPAAQGGGFPVMVATTVQNARVAHEAGFGDFGLALVMAGEAPDGAIILDGYRLAHTPGRSMAANAMRHHCRDQAAQTS